MGLFDGLKILRNNDYKNQENKTVNRKEMDQNLIDEMQKLPASKKYTQFIYDKYYKKHPVKPFISLDREKNTQWLEQASFFPDVSIIPIDIMTPYEDGLLPGHIYLLYWMDKIHRKRIPSYFEYKYGIEFEKEKCFLNKNKYLENEQLTEKGRAAIAVHIDVIESHSPEATSAKKAEQKFANNETVHVEQDKLDRRFITSKIYCVNDRQLMIISPSDYPKVFDGIALLNELLKKIRPILGIQEQLNIPLQEIVFNKNFSERLYTYLDVATLTATGKQVKHPISLFFATKRHHEAMPAFECFGCIRYFQDNSIGCATINFWYSHLGYHINIGIVDNLLSIREVARIDAGKKMTIYKKK